MVPQHSQDTTMARHDMENTSINNNSNNINNQSDNVVFGSQRVDKNSITPYSDATQVSLRF